MFIWAISCIDHRYTDELKNLIQTLFLDGAQHCNVAVVAANLGNFSRRVALVDDLVERALKIEQTTTQSEPGGVERQPGTFTGIIEIDIAQYPASGWLRPGCVRLILRRLPKQLLEDRRCKIPHGEDMTTK